MPAAVKIDAAYKPSEDVVAREIEGEIIIVPLTSGVGDLEDELFTLNETGRAIWTRLDGTTPLSRIAKDLAKEYDAPADTVRRDVLGLVEELLKRRMVVQA